MATGFYPRPALCLSQEKLETCRLVNPDYEILVYDDADSMHSIREFAPHLEDMLNLLKPVERADLWRYLIVFEQGGW